MTEKEFYALRKKACVCVKCGQEDAYTMAGRSYCSICAERAREISKRQREKWPDITHMANERRRKRLLENGLCIYCGKPVQNGRKVCRRCIAKQVSNKREKRIAEGMNWPRGDNGICWQCNKEAVLPGKKLCQACYEMTLRAVRRATETRVGNVGI